MTDVSARLFPASVSAPHNATGSRPELETVEPDKLNARATAGPATAQNSPQPRPDGAGWTDAAVRPLRGESEEVVEVVLGNGIRRSGPAAALTRTQRANVAWWRLTVQNSPQGYVAPTQPEYTGGSVSYYSVAVNNPTTPGAPVYMAECNDIIEALGLNYAEGNAFKAIWRIAAARSGKMKKGYTDGVYDAEKVVFFGERMLAQAKAAR